jgi:hypothetical protein
VMISVLTVPLQQAYCNPPQQRLINGYDNQTGYKFLDLSKPFKLSIKARLSISHVNLPI